MESSWFKNASRSSRRAMYESIATDASSMSSFSSERITRSAAGMSRCHCSRIAGTSSRMYSEYAPR